MWRVVGHDFPNAAAIQDHIAPVNPDAFAGESVMIKKQLAHQDERVFAHCVEKFRAILGGMLNDKLVDKVFAPIVGHVHRDHKYHFSIPV
jgi:hypothetical protein